MKLSDLPPGAILPAAEPVVINADLPVTTLRIANESDYPVHLTAHFHVFEANPLLRFDRRRAFGLRPDLPAGGAVRFEPGETKAIRLVPIGGRCIIHGFAGLVEGPLAGADVDSLLERAITRGYRHQPEPEG